MPPNKEQAHSHAQMKATSLGQLEIKLRNYKTMKEILRLATQKLSKNISFILPAPSYPQTDNALDREGFPTSQIPLTDKK